MVRWLAFAALIGALTGCTSLSLGEERQEIIGGTRSTGLTPTVLLVSYPPDRSYLVTCTAVLVSPTALLTAAHCVDEPNHPDHVYGVFTGDDASIYPSLSAIMPHLVPVASVHPHPDYSTRVPFYGDIAAVVLAEPITNITPAPIRREPLDASFVGREALIVGYGQIVYDEFNNTRYEATTVVGALEMDTVVVGDSEHRACLGDSGGPAYVDGVLIGVDSYGPVGCGAPAHYRRTDWFVPFIDTYAPPVAPDPMPDPDPPVDGEDEDGGCATTKSSGSPLVLALGALAVAGRRRRRRSC